MNFTEVQATSDYTISYTWSDPGGGGGGGQVVRNPPGKSQVDFLKNTGTDPLEKLLGPIASQGRFVRPSVKYVEEKKLLHVFTFTSDYINLIMETNSINPDLTAAGILIWVHIVCNIVYLGNTQTRGADGKCCYWQGKR